MTADTYAINQIDSLPRVGRPDDTFAVKIESRTGAGGVTKWLTITPIELAEFRAILARRP